ncbi:hypothetical protein BBF96_10100 [Anoxybacter fermentans]|uniref:Transposase InsH N-terminal domain-containing protein n=1 Tax=Anoxybacter fermentans TaxID=1323375 RepID=A0A3S9SZB8_9FIRM|nr:hypothetical protein BBF96_10100 [Anoxybacter fermentans]
MELVHIDALVPQDHLLKKIDKYIDFSLITEKTRPFYCEKNRRPCVDSVILFKIMFIGYLFGIRSGYQLGYLILKIQINYSKKTSVCQQPDAKSKMFLKRPSLTFSNNSRSRLNFFILNFD